MAQIREIKKRMTAVGTISRITKTMQMIATAKFTAAVQRAKSTKPFSERIRTLVGQLADGGGDLDHPLVDGPAAPVKRELLLVISSDRGLCGAYNSNVLRGAARHIAELQKAGIACDVETAGKKAVAFCKFQKIAVTEKHSIGDKPAYNDVERVAQGYIEAFSEGRYDAIRVAFMRFETNARQFPEVAQLLPIEPQAQAPGAKTEATGASANYEFSPSREDLLANLLPLAVKSQLFQSFNDAVVSEQIMRMVAMKAATENAKDLGRTLNRDYNRARQAQITTELSEIIAGSAALE